MKILLTVIAYTAFIITLSSCHKSDFPGTPAKRYSNEVAVDWIQLQQQLIKTTPGFGPGPSGRVFAYSGLTMYESIVPGIKGYQSLFLQLATPAVPISAVSNKEYYWPAAMNAAMAQIIRHFFATTSDANKAAIDALELSYTTKFQQSATPGELQRSSDFGKLVASAIFDWSKTDGTFDVNPPYVAPVGTGLWVPTPPAFAPPAAPYGGKIRSFVPNILGLLHIPAPISYSEEPTSDFYKMVNQVYTISQTLTENEIKVAKTWGDIPGNYNGPSHFTNMVTQLVVLNKLPLDETALLYAKHGIAINDAGIPIFKAKYQYNVVRPITYIQNVLKQAGWATLIPTPPHPEYLSAHALIAQATAEVLKAKFGNKYSFTDRTHTDLYGTRSYATFDEYAYEAAWSRVLAGIHYKPTADVSLIIGKEVGKAVNGLPFNK